NPLTARLAIEDEPQQKDNPVFLAKKQRALEQFSAMKIGEQPVVLSMAAPQSGKPSSRETTEKDQEKRVASATFNSPSFIPGLSSAGDKSIRKKSARARNVKNNQKKQHTVASARHAHVVVIKAGKIIEAHGQPRKASSHTRPRSVRTARR